ncbi:MAG: transglutaminaseTgpA domain-containing protein [Verrucomicrobiota bacterium]|nr:transglutaminaseTgpA domain-containing protein [Verrucomicrobiota bacterium]
MSLQSTPFPLFKALSAKGNLTENAVGLGWVMMVWAFFSLFATNSLEWYILAPDAFFLILALVIYRPLHRLSPTKWLGVTALVLGLIAYEYLLTRQVFDAALHLIFYLQFNKFCTTKLDRDYPQLFMLCVLQVLATTILTVSMMFMFFLIVFLIISVAYMIVCAARQSAGEEAEHSTGMFNFRFWRYIAQSVGILLIVILALFIAIPRTAMAKVFVNLNLGTAGATTTMSSFSDNIEWGHTEEIQLNESLAFYVWIDDPHAMKNNKSRLDPYWRVLSLDKFTIRGWEVSSNVAEKTERYNIRREWPGFIPNPQIDFKLHFYMQPEVSRYLIQAENMTGMSLARDESIFSNLLSKSISLKYIPKDNYQYSVFVHRDLKSGAGKGEVPALARILPDEFEHLYLQTPYSGEQLAVLQNIANEASRTTKNQFEQTQSIQNHLLKNFKYTLKTRDKGIKDPLIHFLTVRKEGHCEYFAGSMVMLLRSVGIPARVVVGFAGGEFNAKKKMFTVRQSDAHSWVEVYLPKKGGWIRFDPTPADRTTTHSNFAWVGKKFRLAKEEVTFFWYQQVVNFNLSDQLSFLRNLHQSANVMNNRLNAPNIMPSWVKELKIDLSWTGRKKSTSLNELVVPILCVLGTIAAVVGGVYVFRRSRRSPSLQVRMQHEEAIKLWRKAQRIFHRWNIPMNPSDTPAEIMERVNIKGFPSKEFVECYYSLRHSKNPRIHELSRFQELFKILLSSQRTPAAKKN